MYIIYLSIYLSEGTITGYKRIHLAFPNNGLGQPWGGLGKSGNSNTLAGDAGSNPRGYPWMAVGATKYFTPSEKTIPGPFPHMVKKIELYVKPGPQLLPVGKYSYQTFFQFSIPICYGNTGNIL